MRPDVAAFRELDTLVRNLSEQLAGYRRRALAGESRARELEQQLAAVESKLAAAVELSRRPAPVVTATPSPSRSSVGGASAASTPARFSPELQSENDRLRAQLLEARERTIQVADRVRFLRQQLTGGAEK